MTNELRQKHREDYLGATFSLLLLRFGLFCQLKTGEFLSTAALVSLIFALRMRKE